MMPLRKRVGHLLIAGLEGAEISVAERAWLKDIEPSGVILFRRNIEAAGQTYGLLAEASSSSDTPIFRCVDLEGGLVDRLRDLIAPMPSLAAVAASGNRVLYRKHGKLIGRESQLLGFNTVFAPVLDLALPESRSVMRTRTYFDKPEDLISYAGAFLGGLESEQVLGCGKHFPGLGGGTLDSHHATPVIDRDWTTLWRNDLLPYRKLKARLPMVMVSHASYPAAGDNKPASISQHWITDVLTARLQYRGLIISDDMEMGGIVTHCSIEEAAVQAVLAGTHLIEICKDAALINRAYEALVAEAERSLAFGRIVEKASRKILKVRRSLAAVSTTASPSLSELKLLRTQIEAFRAKIADAEMTGAL